MKETQENRSSKMQCSVRDEHIIPQIVEQDVKFNSRVLSRESSRANSSSRVFYYGGAKGAVPFLWESRPGTPKHHTLVDTYNAPPLTPPPSYYGSPKSKSMHKNTKPRVLRNLFSKLAPTTRATVDDIWSSPSLSSTSTSSSSSSKWGATSYPSPSNNSRSRHGQNRTACSRLDPFFGECNRNDNDIIDEENGIDSNSPTSTLRFCGGRSKNFMKFLGCYPMKRMTNAFLSIAVRHGSK